MRVWILIGLLLASSASANIIPADFGPTNDPYSNYQWAIANTGQKVLHDIDDIHATPLQGTPADAIGWSNQLENLMQKDVVVAVIDSGIDVDHEDLKSQIYVNTIECTSDGHIPIAETVTGDRDHNGYDGDCMGWNFADRSKEGLQKRLVDDTMGHGTHVAGIIAATSGNGKGITGVSNRIKILPIKIFNENEKFGASLEKITDRVSLAIDYAVSRKADVINLSLGWPIISNTPGVQESVKRAIARGVEIVAGSGNDNHSLPIYPCAFKDVICVGSTDVNGRMSSFSNYGGHVDVLAPGGDILSLVPMTMNPVLFGVKGYGIRSGTSQSTPYVSAMVAALKSAYPGITHNQILQRLYNSARGLNDESLRGSVDLLKAVTQVGSPIVVPSFKEVNYFLAFGNTVEVPVTLKNLGNTPHSFDVVIESVNPTFQLRAAKTLTLQANEVRDFKELAIITDWNGHAFLKLKVTIKNPDGTEKSYESEHLVARSTEGVAKDVQQESATTKGTVTVFGLGQGPHEYFENIGTREKLIVRISRLEDVVKPIADVELPGISDLVTDMPLIKADLNGDGKLDYWFSGIARNKKGEISSLHYFLFNDQFQPLVNGISDFELKYESTTISPTTLRFVEVKTKEFGNLRMPMFWQDSFIPELDKNPDDFAFEANTKGYRLYYLEPRMENGKAVMRTRLFNNYLFAENITKALKIDPKQDYYLHASLAQSKQNIADGVVHLLLSYGNGINRQYKALRVDAEALTTRSPASVDVQTNGLDLQRQRYGEALSLEANGEESYSTRIVAAYTLSDMRVVTLVDNQLTSSIHYTVSIPNDSIRGLLQTFIKNDDVTNFFETETLLGVAGRRNGVTFVDETAIYRSSFVPGAVFSQRFIPVWVEDSKEGKVPALFVDNSNIFSRVAFTWTLTDTKLSVPLRLSFEVPTGCRVMQPLRDNGHYEMIFSCDAQKKLKVIPFEK